MSERDFRLKPLEVAGDEPLTLPQVEEATSDWPRHIKFADFHPGNQARVRCVLAGLRAYYEHDRAQLSRDAPIQSIIYYFLNDLRHLLDVIGDDDDRLGVADDRQWPDGKYRADIGGYV